MSANPLLGFVNDNGTTREEEDLRERSTKKTKEKANRIMNEGVEMSMEEGEHEQYAGRKNIIDIQTIKTYKEMVLGGEDQTTNEGRLDFLEWGSDEDIGDRRMRMGFV